MFYTYRCDLCNNEEDFEYPMTTDKPRRLDCPSCKGKTSMHQVFGSVVIPDTFKALGGADSFDYTKKATGKKFF